MKLVAEGGGQLHFMTTPTWCSDKPAAKSTPGGYAHSDLKQLD